MAKAAGVIMNECRLLEDAGYAHFITKRFDRNNNNNSYADIRSNFTYRLQYSGIMQL